MCLTLSQRQNQKDVPILKLVVDTLGTQVAARTFDLSAEAYVGGIYLQHMQFKGKQFMFSQTAETGSLRNVY